MPCPNTTLYNTLTSGTFRKVLDNSQNALADSDYVTTVAERKRQHQPPTRTRSSRINALRNAVNVANIIRLQLCAVHHLHCRRHCAACCFRSHNAERTASHTISFQPEPFPIRQFQSNVFTFLRVHVHVSSSSCRPLIRTCLFAVALRSLPALSVNNFCGLRCIQQKSLLFDIVRSVFTLLAPSSGQHFRRFNHIAP